MEGESQEGGFKGFWKRHKLFVLGSVGLLVAFVVIKYFGSQGQATVAATTSSLGLGATPPTTGSGGLPGAPPAPPTPVPPTPAPGTHPAENNGVPVSTFGTNIGGIAGSGPANPPRFIGPPVHKPPVPKGSGPPAPPNRTPTGGGIVGALKGYSVGGIAASGALPSALVGGIGSTSVGANALLGGAAPTLGNFLARLFGGKSGMPLPVVGAVIPGIGAHVKASSPHPASPPADVLAASVVLQHPNLNTPLAHGGGGPTPTAPDVHASARPAYSPPAPAPAAVGLAHHQPAPLPPHRIGVQGQHGGQLY